MNNENLELKKPLMPNHDDELRSSTKTFEYLNKKYRVVVKAHKGNELTKDDLDSWVNSLKYQVEDILYQVGELSLCVRELKEPLRMYYYNNFKPAIAEGMFENEYDEAELPYDTIKNRCFQLIGKMIGIRL